MVRALLLLFIGIFSLSAISFAEDSKIEDRKFYLKAMADRGFFQNSKASPDAAVRKYKNHSAVNSADIGAGYYFNDEFRGEVVYHQEFNNKFGANFQSRAPVSRALRNITRSSKNQLSALTIGVSMNVIDFDYGKIFLSGNLGVAQAKESVSYTGTLAATGQSLPPAYYAGKKQNNLAYGVGIGADFKLSERLHAEIAYRYSDYGQTRSLKPSSTSAELGKTKLRSHNALIGLRVDM